MIQYGTVRGMTIKYIITTTIQRLWQLSYQEMNSSADTKMQAVMKICGCLLSVQNWTHKSLTIHFQNPR